MDDDGPIDSAVIARKQHEIQLIRFATATKPESQAWGNSGKPSKTIHSRWTMVDVCWSMSPWSKSLPYRQVLQVHRKTFVRFMARTFDRPGWLTTATAVLWHGRLSSSESCYERYAPVNSHSYWTLKWHNSLQYLPIRKGDLSWLC